MGFIQSMGKKQMTLILPEKVETQAVKRGRAILREIIDKSLELADRGKSPNRVYISTALNDDLKAFFDFAYEWDGILPSTYANIPIEYVHGTDRKIHIVCDNDLN